MTRGRVGAVSVPPYPPHCMCSLCECLGGGSSSSTPPNLPPLTSPPPLQIRSWRVEAAGGHAVAAVSGWLKVGAAVAGWLKVGAAVLGGLKMGAAVAGAQGGCGNSRGALKASAAVAGGLKMARY